MKNTPVLVDNPNAPSVFANDASGFFLHEGCVSITFEVGKVDHSSSPGPVNRVVLGTLVMPVAGAHRLVDGLCSLLAQHESEEAGQKLRKVQ